MIALIAIVGVIMPILLVLNLVGGLVSGIWLAVAGEWWAIGYGLLGVALSHIILSLLMMPSLLLAGPAESSLEKGRTGIATALSALAALYIGLIATAWSTGVLLLFLSRATEATLVPLLLWSFAAATGPYAFLSSKDQQEGGNEYSLMTTFFLQFAYLIGALVVLFLNATPAAFAVIVGLFMTLSAVLQVSAATQAEARKGTPT